MVHICNQEIMNILRCDKAELRRLQRTLKAQMQEFYVDGEPLIGALISKVDQDGTKRDAVWEAVAESDRTCETLLTGARWGRHLPTDFYSLLEGFKHEMERRLNGPYRQRAKEARTRHPIHFVHMINLLDEVANVDEDDPMEGRAPTQSEGTDEHAINSTRLNSPGEGEPAPIIAPPTMSASIQDAVQRATADLAARISDVENRETIRIQDRDLWEAELAARLLEREKVLLAPINAEIKTLKAKLEAERLCRES